MVPHNDNRMCAKSPVGRMNGPGESVPASSPCSPSYLPKSGTSPAPPLAQKSRELFWSGPVVRAIMVMDHLKESAEGNSVSRLVGIWKPPKGSLGTAENLALSNPRIDPCSVARGGRISKNRFDTRILCNVNPCPWSDSDG